MRSPLGPIAIGSRRFPACGKRLPRRGSRRVSGPMRPALDSAIAVPRGFVRAECPGSRSCMRNFEAAGFANPIARTAAGHADFDPISPLSRDGSFRRTDSPRASAPGDLAYGIRHPLAIEDSPRASAPDGLPAIGDRGIGLRVGALALSQHRPLKRLRSGRRGFVLPHPGCRARRNSARRPVAPPAFVSRPRGFLDGGNPSPSPSPSTSNFVLRLASERLSRSSAGLGGLRMFELRAVFPGQECDGWKTMESSSIASATTHGGNAQYQHSRRFFLGGSSSRACGFFRGVSRCRSGRSGLLAPVARARFRHSGMVRSCAGRASRRARRAGSCRLSRERLDRDREFPARPGLQYRRRHLSRLPSAFVGSCGTERRGPIARGGFSRRFPRGTPSHSPRDPLSCACGSGSVGDLRHSWSRAFEA